MAVTTFRGLLCAAVLLVLGTSIPCSADTMLFDGTFQPSNYKVAVDYNGSPSQTALDIFRCSNCGDPKAGVGALLVIKPSSSVDFVSTVFGAVNSSWVYDPSTQGAITDLDYSVNKKLQTNGGSISSNTGIPLLEQDGNLYVDFLSGPLAVGPYESIIGTDLVASDFGELVLSPSGVTDNSSINPNFSSTGDPIDFGFAIQLNQDSSKKPIFSFVTEDNIKYDLTTVPVPEPSSIMLLLAGLGLIGWVVLRRDKVARVSNRA